MKKNKPEDGIIGAEPQTVSEASTGPQPSFRLNIGLMVGIAFLAAIGGGWLYRDVLATYLPNDQMRLMASRIDALEADNKQAATRVDAVIARSDELNAKLGAARGAADKAAKDSADLLARSQTNDATVADMQQKLDQARADLDTVKSKLNLGVEAAAASADPTLARRLDEMENNLAALRAAVPPKFDADRLKQSFAAVKAKISDGAPFAAELSGYVHIMPMADGLDVLSAESTKGLPNARQLGAALDQVIAQLPKPEAKPSSGGWMDRLSNLFSGFVSIKSLGSDDWSIVAAKASALIAAGDLPQAQALFTSAGDAPPAPLAAWCDLLQRRIKLEDALAKASAATSREIAAKG